MAGTKSSDIRYQVLDRCLRRGGYSTARLAEAVNRELELRGYATVTSLNTIRKDMDHMAANHQVEIVEQREGRSVTYGYSEREMSIYNVGLSDDDVVQLSQAFALLSRFDGIPQLDWVRSAISQLRLSVNIETQGVPIVGFDDCARLKGRQYFRRLLSAIHNRTVLNVQYLKYNSSEPKTFVVSPCYLKEHSRRWFLLGMTEHHDAPMVLALDRIDSVTEMPDAEYRPADGFDFNNEYFKDIVGVTRFHGQEPETVLLEVDNRRLQYLTTKPIHDSQKVIEVGEATSLVSLNVILNVELGQFLLAYGPAVTVVSPPEYREYMADMVHDMAVNYWSCEEE